MEPRLDVITLAVADLERALAFYRALGFESKGVVGTEWVDERTGASGAVAMFELDGGLLLNLYPRDDLAKDAAIPAGPPQSGEFSLAQLVRSRDEVDELLEKRGGRGRHDHTGPRPTVGDLLRLLPRSRWPPLGGHLAPGQSSETARLTPHDARDRRAATRRENGGPPIELRPVLLVDS